ncbi:MAG: CHAT domain-containing protein [Acidimicrobiales bacterium]
MRTGDGRQRSCTIGCTPATVQRLLDHHEGTLARRSAPGGVALWESPTEEFLAAVYDAVSRHLVELLAGFGRAALAIGDPLLTLLPIETAHDDLGPALFELMQIHRLVGSPRWRPRRDATRRSFTLRLERGDDEGLIATALERLLVVAAHRSNGGPAHHPSERLVHLAGHDPRLSHVAFDRREAAHVVLSGCSSIPSSLIPGVASATCTLWPVDDWSGSAVMAALHARIAAGIGPAEALRQAQLLHRSLSPSGWASYVHVGVPD